MSTTTMYPPLGTLNATAQQVVGQSGNTYNPVATLANGLGTAAVNNQDVPALIAAGWTFTADLGYYATYAALNTAYPSANVPNGTRAYTGDVGAVWSNGSQWQLLPGFQSINPQEFGTFDTTGATPCDSVLQLAINAACSLRLPLILPPGLLLLDNPLNLTPAKNTSQTLQMFGIGTQPLESKYGGGALSGTNNNFTIFMKNFNNGPAMDATGYRFLRLANFAISGENAVSQYQFPNRFDTNYVINGARDSQYSPDCGISLDGCVRQSSSVAAPPDGGYPNLTYSTGNLPSSNALIEDVSCVGHVVGFAITPAGAGSLTDQTTFRRCNATVNKVGLAMGQAQSKVTVIQGGNWGSCQTVFDGLRYGVQSGCSPVDISNCNFGYAYELFNLASSGAFAFSMRNCYIESVRRLGSFGNGGGTNRNQISIHDLQTNFTSSGGIPLPPICFETYGPAFLHNLNFGIDSGNVYFWNLVSDTTGSFNSPIVCQTCTFRGSGASQLMPFIGISNTGCSTRLRECFSTAQNYPSLPLSDDSTNDISNFSWNNRVSSVGIKGSRYANGTGVVDVKTTNINGYVTLTVSALTITTLALTLSTSPIAGATSGTLSSGTFGGATNFYPVTFNSGEVRYAVCTNGSNSINWLGSGLTQTETAAITVGNVTLTFTYSGTALQVGDFLLWQHTEQTIGGSGSKRTVPTWQITSISGTTYTCTPVVEASCIDTVANNPSNQVSVLQYQWAPYGQTFSGTASTSSTSLTSVTPATGILNGDWVQDTAGYLPANTRVVSGAGTGTLVLNNTPTGNGSTNLRFNVCQTPTMTDTWD